MPTIEITTERSHPKFLVAWGKQVWELSADPNDGIPEGCISQLEFLLQQRRRRKGRKAEEVAA